MNRLPAAFVVGLATLALGQTAHAVIMDYSFTGVATGTLAGAPFASEPFVITLTAETADIVSQGFFVSWVEGPARIEFTNLGSGVFTTNKRIFSARDIPAIGFAHPGSEGDLIDCFDPAFAGYRLDTELGPIFESMPVAVEQFQNVSTTLGSLWIFDLPQGVTFQAQFVPAPASASLLLGLLFVGRRRR